MKVLQVNNSQPNFKNWGIVAKKGAANLLVGAQNPELLEMAAKGLIRDDLPGHDYFLFTDEYAALRSRVSNHLSNVLGMEEMSVGSLIPYPNEAPLTMEDLISVCNCTHV
jgi:hypothetical protein